LKLWLSSALLISCANLAKIPDFNIYATLPATAGVQDGRHDGVKVNVLTGDYELIPKETWFEMEKRTIKLMPEDYAVIKKAFYGACIHQDCAQQLDLISHVFENIDASLGKIPGVK